MALPRAISAVHADADTTRKTSGFLVVAPGTLSVKRTLADSVLGAVV